MPRGWCFMHTPPLPGEEAPPRPPQAASWQPRGWRAAQPGPQSCSSRKREIPADWPALLPTNLPPDVLTTQAEVHLSESEQNSQPLHFRGEGSQRSCRELIFFPHTHKAAAGAPPQTSCAWGCASGPGIALSRSQGQRGLPWPHRCESAWLSEELIYCW